MGTMRKDSPLPRLAALTGLRGRRLHLRLAGRLDAKLAASVRALLEGQTGVGAIALECSRLHDLDPAGARSLARTLADWRERGAWIEFRGLRDPLRRRLSRHPLGIYGDPEEELFGDPDRDERGAQASRR